MKNFKNIGKALSRNEMRSVNAGLASAKGCTLTVKRPNGTYQTLNGTCRNLGSLSAPGEYILATTITYCDTGDGIAYPLTSNGGVSRC